MTKKELDQRVSQRKITDQRTYIIDDLIGILPGPESSNCIFHVYLQSKKFTGYWCMEHGKTFDCINCDDHELHT